MSNFLAKLMSQISFSKRPHPSNSLTIRRFVFWVRQNDGCQDLLFTFGAFAPRAEIFCIATITAVQQTHSLWIFVAGPPVFFVATNRPFFFYYGIGFAFLTTETHASVISQIYLYYWIPLFMIGSLTIL